MTKKEAKQFVDEYLERSRNGNRDMDIERVILNIRKTRRVFKKYARMADKPMYKLAKGKLRKMLK